MFTLRFHFRDRNKRNGRTGKRTPRGHALNGEQDVSSPFPMNLWTCAPLAPREGCLTRSVRSTSRVGYVSGNCPWGPKHRNRSETYHLRRRPDRWNQIALRRPSPLSALAWCVSLLDWSHSSFGHNRSRILHVANRLRVPGGRIRPTPLAGVDGMTFTTQRPYEQLVPMPLAGMERMTGRAERMSVVKIVRPTPASGVEARMVRVGRGSENRSPHAGTRPTWTALWTCAPLASRKGCLTRSVRSTGVLKPSRRRLLCVGAFP